jgi:hypothetical protein
MIALITSLDPSKEKSFSGGCQWLNEWFRKVQDVLPPNEKQLDADALEMATKTFLDSVLTDPRAPILSFRHFLLACLRAQSFLVVVVVVGGYSVVFRWGCFCGSCFCCSIVGIVLWCVFTRSLWAFGV